MNCETYREELLSVLYGEADAAALARFEGHRAACAGCREELAALRALRQTLQTWKLPEGLVPRARRTGGPGRRPLAVAAILMLALAGGLVLSGVPLQAPLAGLGLARGAQPDVERLLAAQERRHRRELLALEERLRESAPARDDGALLHRMQIMIRESETRQTLLLNASLRELDEQNEARRRYDLARISAGLSYLEGMTGQQVARTTELMGYVLQASQKR